MLIVVLIVVLLVATKVLIENADINPLDLAEKDLLHKSKLKHISRYTFDTLTVM
jgi:hypothetical protein